MRATNSGSRGHVSGSPRERLIFCALLVILTMFLTACGGNSSSSTASSTTPLHLYVGVEAVPTGGETPGCSTGELLTFTLPISSASTPTFTAPGISNVGSLAANGKGNIAVSRGDFCQFVGGAEIDIYQTALGNSSIPLTHDLSITSGQPVFSATGDLFVPSKVHAVQFKAPLRRGITPSQLIPPQPNTNFNAMGLDLNNNLIIAGCYPDGCNLLALAPPYSGTPVATALMHFGYVGIAINETQLFALAPASGIDVYNLPIVASSQPIFSITKGLNLSLLTAQGIALDADDNLYVVSSDSITVYNPPYSAASIPSFTLPLGVEAATSIAVGK
jgi:hypothetical protein